MTLILALANRDFSVQVSDRRCTTPAGPVTDEANKASVLITKDSRLLVGYTGLAGNTVAAVQNDEPVENPLVFKTSQWLLHALGDAAPPDFLAQEMIRRFADRASNDFRTLPSLRRLSSTDKRLTVMFTGYHHGCDPPLAVAALVSNFQNSDTCLEPAVASDRFGITYFNVKAARVDDFTYIQRVGIWRAMKEADHLSLRLMLEARKPVRAIIDKAVKLVRDMADRPEASGAIGKQLNVVVLPRSLQEPAHSEYHSNTDSYKIFMPNLVVARPGEEMMMMGVEVGVEPRHGVSPLVVRKVNRNSPCPCRSGKKYKYCHGFAPQRPQRNSDRRSS